MLPHHDVARLYHEWELPAQLFLLAQYIYKFSFFKGLIDNFIYNRHRPAPQSLYLKLESFLNSWTQSRLPASAVQMERLTRCS